MPGKINEKHFQEDIILVSQGKPPINYPLHQHHLALLLACSSISVAASIYYASSAGIATKNIMALFQGHPTVPLTSLNTHGREFAALLALCSIGSNFILNFYATDNMFTGPQRSKAKQSWAFLLSTAAVLGLAAITYYVHRNKPLWEILIDVIVALLNLPLQYLGIASLIDIIANFFASTAEKEKQQQLSHFLYQLEDLDRLETFVKEISNQNTKLITIQNTIEPFRAHIATQDHSLQRQFFAFLSTMLSGPFLMGSGFANVVCSIIATGLGIAPLITGVITTIFGESSSLTIQLLWWILLSAVAVFCNLGLLALTMKASCISTKKVYHYSLGSPPQPETLALLESGFESINTIEIHSKKTRSLALHIAPTLTYVSFAGLLLLALLAFGSTYLVFLIGLTFIMNTMASYSLIDLSSSFFSTYIYWIIFALAVINTALENAVLPAAIVEKMVLSANSSMLCSVPENQKLILTQTFLKKNASDILDTLDSQDTTTVIKEEKPVKKKWCFGFFESDPNPIEKLVLSPM